MNAASNNSRKIFPFERLVLKIKTTAQKVMTKEKKSKKLKENPIAKRTKKNKQACI